MTYSSASGMTAIGVIFPVFTLGFLTLRVYQLLQHTRKLGIDDVLIIIAAPLTIGTGVSLAVGAQLGIISGDASPLTNHEDVLKLAKFEYAFWIVHVVTMGVIKLAILFLLRRVFRGRSYWTGFDYANWIMIGCVSLWTILFLLLYVFESGVHPSLGWTTADSVRQRPFNTWAMIAGSASCSWVMDLSILIEPLFMIGTLKMGLRKKIQASMVFLCSGFAVIAGLLRMIVAIQLASEGVTGQTMRFLATDFAIYDVKGIVSIILFWTYVEIGVGFSVACLPSCARYLDILSFDPIVSRIRSFASVISLPRWSRGSGTEDRDEGTSQRTPKSSINNHSEDEMELVAVANGV
ncbi:hypothetical protein F4805DRAFT_437047 [Annulohypoxylon moriforme]|nr:hypothetical protein F4805DRAFT_437047 [Annulohypoxylon moriforme]